MSEFGNRLKELRIAKKWNQEDLANAMGLTQASISQFEKGQRIPTPANINKFAEVLGVSRESLAGENDGKFEKEMLMRNIRDLTPETLRKINEIVEIYKNNQKK